MVVVINSKDDLWTPTEIAERLQCSTETARKMIKNECFGHPINCGLGQSRKRFKVFKCQVLAYLSKKGSSLDLDEQRQLRLFEE